MAFIDWIPIASTIRHLLQNPKGIRVSDYTCNMDSRACIGGEQSLIAAAVLQCQKDIDQQLLANVQNYVGSFGDAFVHDAVGDIVGVAIAYLIKKNIAKAGGLSIPAVGVVLGVDSIVDLSVVIATLKRMKDAAARAKIVCCKCAEAKCSGAKVNSVALTIVRWYLGPERSLEQTTKEAQDYADNNYTCNGNCENGTCKPKVYIIEWDQKHFFSTRTWLKYDVYCECY